ncbi:hypothetical protein DMUE_0868 [Dictyocoela muelleri]|nr:hypothetical protein DMUE_0868 [Dictyocoela muelleri]
MLNRLNYLTDFEFFIYISEKNVLELFQALGAIPKTKRCHKCKNFMEIKPNSKYNFKYACKCGKCSSLKNLLSDCALKNTEIDPVVFLRFAFYFFNRVHFTSEYIMNNCKIGEDMYGTLVSLFREKISKFVVKNQRMLGGVLKEVQIDETFWSRRKYGVGRLGKAVWIWGAVEKKTGYCYLQKVDNRSCETLIPIIQKNIKSRSYVVSDKWSAYKSIGKYFRDSVCHKYNFVDPETKANTQTIENIWSLLKKIKHYSYGIKIETLNDHLNVFMFFKNYKHIEFGEFLDIILN